MTQCYISQEPHEPLQCRRYHVYLLAEVVNEPQWNIFTSMLITSDGKGTGVMNIMNMITMFLHLQVHGVVYSRGAWRMVQSSVDLILLQKVL